MLKFLFACVLFALSLPAQNPSQTRAMFPVDITSGPSPQPVTINGKTHLVYELHLTSFAPISMELTRVDVLAGDGTDPLASYSGEALEKMTVPVEKTFVSVKPVGSAAKVRTISEGHSVVIFLDVVLDAGVRSPAKLRHLLSISFPRKSGGTIDNTVNGLVVAVVQEAVPVLQAPLRGSAWIAFNALANYDHRRAFVAVDGKITIAQRFAIDWMCLGPDGRLFRGDSKSNANFYSYGAEVLAVANGHISDLKDNLPENAGSNERSDRTINLDNVLGNYVVLDLGQGHFALYAHLQPGSLKVKVGEAVEAGQVLGLLGNSGNSDAPHLHFHLVDASSPLNSEGIPYELKTFTQQGVLPNSEMLDTGQPWHPKTGVQPLVRRGEFPPDNAVLAFP